MVIILGVPIFRIFTVISDSSRENTENRQDPDQTLQLPARHACLGLFSSQSKPVGFHRLSSLANDSATVGTFKNNTDINQLKTA